MCANKAKITQQKLNANSIVHKIYPVREKSKKNIHRENGRTFERNCVRR